MLVSMTGFGFGHYEDKSISIDVEIRSFNSRYFELQTRYFDLSGETEYKIRRFLKKKLNNHLIILKKILNLVQEKYFIGLLNIHWGMRNL